MVRIYAQFRPGPLYWYYCADERRSVGTICYLTIE
jgi:hypothetical protein